jgi:NAD-dependent SIR2 family protein deacetylase
VLVEGTSATVYQEAGFALSDKQRSGRLIEINLHDSEITRVCDLSLRGGSATVLPRLLAAAAKKRRATLA